MCRVELADLGQQGLFPSLELLGEIARVAAESLGANGVEVVVASLHSPYGQPEAGCLTTFELHCSTSANVSACCRAASAAVAFP